MAEDKPSRWQPACAPNARAALAEWRAILDTGLEAVIDVPTGEDERSVRLRQSTPFTGERIMARAERNGLWRQFAP